MDYFFFDFDLNSGTVTIPNERNKSSKPMKAATINPLLIEKFAGPTFDQML
jgi:hypothetical protein